jgi:hypothetical protein
LLVLDRDTLAGGGGVIGTQHGEVRVLVQELLLRCQEVDLGEVHYVGRGGGILGPQELVSGRQGEGALELGEIKDCLDWMVLEKLEGRRLLVALEKVALVRGVLSHYVLLST